VVEVQLNTLSKYEGAFRVAAVSGLITGVAAGTNAAGHLFAMRWSPPTAPYSEKMVRLCVIQRFRAKWRTTAGPTAAQEMALDAFRVTSYSASHAGGTAVNLANPNNMKRTVTPPAAGVNSAGLSASLMADMRIATTAALTNGTETFDAQAFAHDSYSELVVAATVQLGRFDLEFLNQDQPGFPIVLAPNEGIVVRNGAVAMGAGLVGRLVVEVDWLEMSRFPS